VTTTSNVRLVVLSVLILSLLLTVLGRLFVIQVVSGSSFQEAAANNRVREAYTPAVRGLILDQQGRPLVSNRTTLVVTVDRTTVVRQKDGGKLVLARLASVLGTTYLDLLDRLQLCGTPDAKKPPICWNGSPYQPIPVAKDVPTDIALQIMEQRGLFPGIKAELNSVRIYPKPFDVNAAAMLGYLGPVKDSELEALVAGQDEQGRQLSRTDLVGRAGLEDQYDAQLRGKPGIKKLAIDRSGAITGVLEESQPVPGNFVVTSIDAKLQKVVEDQLRSAVFRARQQGKKGDSGAAVVMDVTTGQVLAMASFPSYDPEVWSGGINKKEYQSLTSEASGYPLVPRATQGLYPPASAFKPVSAIAAGESGYKLNGKYNCGAYFEVAKQKFKNNESQAFGPITVQRAIEVSCNTVFYDLAYRMWLKDGGSNPTPKAQDAIETVARAAGMGRPSGIDLPNEAAGRVGGREFKKANWERYKDIWCARRTDPSRTPIQRAVDEDNCFGGNKFRGGDAVNLAIGQGDTVVTPLQMAVLYSAIANGGTVWQPRVAKAIISSSGEVIETTKAQVAGRLGVPPAVLAYVKKALIGVSTEGTAARDFQGFPLDQIPIASKTGSGQQVGKDPATWVASYAPANKPKYAVVMMVNQGETGSTTVGPSVRKIYEAIFGIRGGTVDPTLSVLVGGAPNSNLPKIGKDGSLTYPEKSTSS